MPVQRMQCVSRAGPSRIWVSFKPSPSRISICSCGISRPSNSSSQWPPWSSGPMMPIRRAILHPGWSAWNRKALRPRLFVSEVRAMRMKCLAFAAPVMNHLRPCTTHLSPRCSARVSIIPGSRPGTRLRLCHGKRGLHPAIDNGLQPALLLRLRQYFFQRQHGAVIRGSAVETDRAEDRAVHLLIAHGHADHVQAQPAITPRHLRRPHPGPLDLFADRTQARAARCCGIRLCNPRA